MNIFNRITHDIPQGSQEWHAFRAVHYGASELSAAAGVGYDTRTELLDLKVSGVAKEVDERTQEKFDKGHAVEVGGRAMAEEILGEDLIPAVMSVVVDGLPLSASLDGKTFSGHIILEHKLWSKKREEEINSGHLSEMDMLQMDQELLVSGAEKCLFMCSDGTKNNCAWCWYTTTPDRAAAVVATWAQFDKDKKSHVITAKIAKPKAEVVAGLPTLFAHARGEITAHNMDAFGIALTSRLAEVRAIVLSTDQDFANAKAEGSFLRDKAKEIKLCKDAMLAQTATVGEAARMMDEWVKDLNATALQLEKNVEREDLAKKRAMTTNAMQAYDEHVTALEVDTQPIKLNCAQPDFASAIKGKRNYQSMQDAIDAALANGKIAADDMAKDISEKLSWYNSEASNFKFLFYDLQTIIQKPRDDFELLAKSRITAHKVAEAEKVEARAVALAKQKAAVAEAENLRAKMPVIESERANSEAQDQVDERMSSPPTKPSKHELARAVQDKFNVSSHVAMMWLMEAFGSEAAREAMASLQSK